MPTDRHDPDGPDWGAVSEPPPALPTPDRGEDPDPRRMRTEAGQRAAARDALRRAAERAAQEAVPEPEPVPDPAPAPPLRAVGAHPDDPRPWRGAARATPAASHHAAGVAAPSDPGRLLDPPPALEAPLTLVALPVADVLTVTRWLEATGCDPADGRYASPTETLGRLLDALRGTTLDALRASRPTADGPLGPRPEDDTAAAREAVLARVADLAATAHPAALLELARALEAMS